ncbi:MAG: hypothetical protein HYV28_05955 [Ignavibacteriales bacterium]|nr:hypothetical protein [Ignavibacteriales bacterium]
MQYNTLKNSNDETSLSEFTYFLAELPVKYYYKTTSKKPKVLILGGGSLYSIKRTAPFASFVTLVEIDPAVIKSSLLCWNELGNPGETTNYRIIIDDAKRYLKSTVEKYDVIIMDISAPYYLATALLHNKDFYSIIHKSLNPGGLFSESTQGRPNKNDATSMGMKILKGVDDIFPNYLFIDCYKQPRGKRGFIISANDLELNPDQITTQLISDQKNTGVKVFNKQNIPFRLKDVKAYSNNNMEELVSENFGRIKSRIQPDNRLEGSGTYSKMQKQRTEEIRFSFLSTIGKRISSIFTF